MQPKPYIGVTGVMTRKESEALCDALSADNDFLVMIGMLASGKTIHGMPNKWPKRYPKAEDMGKISFDHPKALFLVHFNTKDPEKLHWDMCHALYLAGPHCHGLQLNIAWPDVRVLQDFHRDSQSDWCKTIVLQCGEKALDEVGWSGAKLAERLKRYEGLIDYVLIDPSGGLGKEFDPDFACRCFRMIAKTLPDVGLGIAGGLGSTNLGRLLGPILLAFPDLKFSIDVEARVRDHADNLNVPDAIRYLKSGDLILGRKEAIC